MHGLKNVYNRMYVFFQTHLNSDVKTHKNLIDQAVQDVIKENKIQGDTSNFKTALTARIIMQYKNIQFKDSSVAHDKKDRMEAAIHVVQRYYREKTTFQHEINKLPPTLLENVLENNFQSNKAAYLIFLKTSKSDSDKELNKVLNDPRVQVLAKKVESEMKNVTNLKDVVKVLIATRNDILKLYEGKSAIGRDEMTITFFTILLLQKNNELANGVKNLQKYFEGLSIRDYNQLVNINSLNMSVYTGVEFIETRHWLNVGNRANG